MTGIRWYEKGEEPVIQQVFTVTEAFEILSRKKNILFDFSNGTF